MYFDSLHDVLYMKGHGAFVWSAYAIAIGVLVGLVYVPISRSRRFMRDQRQRLLREEPREKSRDESRTRGTAAADK